MCKQTAGFLSSFKVGDELNTKEQTERERKRGGGLRTLCPHTSLTDPNLPLYLFSFSHLSILVITRSLKLLLVFFFSFLFCSPPSSIFSLQSFPPDGRLPLPPPLLSSQGLNLARASQPCDLTSCLTTDWQELNQTHSQTSGACKCRTWKNMR